MICQMGIVVKEIAWKPIPFANRDEGSMDEFRRVLGNRVEMASHGLTAVSRDFSFAVHKVRKARTIEWKSVLELTAKGFDVIKNRENESPLPRLED